MRAEHKDQVRSEVTARIVSRIAADPAALNEVLSDTLYHERRRLEKERYATESGDVGFWRAASKRLVASSTSGQRDLLSEVVTRFVNEIMGHFDPRVYSMATRVLPTGLGALLNSLDPRRVFRNDVKQAGLREHVIIKGETDAAVRLANKGTLVVVPTHLSNLDSIVMGYAAYLMGLPPLLYGAGLNLFQNKLMGFFMRNLGAYTVDRRKKAGLYKDVLKEYATYAIELGYHSLFFPGGTRIRSGGVERKLKKGLLGTGLAAYHNNLRAGRPRPDIFVLPCTISYGLVLEASTLIQDHLKAVGKSRFIIIDDEFSRPRRIAQFMSELLKLNSRIFITFGAPLDVFGNRVDFQGRSLDPRGRPIDITRYVCRDGEVIDDPQRDREYTGELAASIVRSFERCNRPQATNLVAFAAFQLMKAERPDCDLYRLLNEGMGPVGFPRREMVSAVDSLLTEVRARCSDERLMIDPRLQEKGATEIVDHALRHFANYHHSRALRASGERIHVDDPQLVYYYHNRLTGYGLESAVNTTTRAA